MKLAFSDTHPHVAVDMLQWGGCVKRKPSEVHFPLFQLPLLLPFLSCPYSQAGYDQWLG